MHGYDKDGPSAIIDTSALVAALDQEPEAEQNRALPRFHL
jgi:hypothetical protein